jgi:hypothetical protein
MQILVSAASTHRGSKAAVSGSTVYMGWWTGWLASNSSIGDTTVERVDVNDIVETSRITRVAAELSPP